MKKFLRVFCVPELGIALFIFVTWYTEGYCYFVQNDATHQKLNQGLSTEGYLKLRPAIVNY